MIRKALLVSLIAAAACGGASSIADANLPNVVGTWTLKTVNGAPPPGVVQTSPKIELLEDAYTFNAGGSYNETGSQRTTTSTGILTETATETGNWILGKSSITLAPSTGGAYPATVTDTSITFTFGTTLVLVYKR
jgi:hypothetical protein